MAAVATGAARATAAAGAAPAAAHIDFDLRSTHTSASQRAGTRARERVGIGLASGAVTRGGLRSEWWLGGEGGTPTPEANNEKLTAEVVGLLQARVFT